MKKLLTFLLFLAVCAIAENVSAQTSPQTVSRIRDGVNATTYANVDQLTLTYSPTSYGLATLAGVYFYDGANLRRWAGDALNSDAVAVATEAPYTGSFGHFYSTSTVWKRMVGGALSDALLSTRDMMWVGSYNLFRDTGADVYRRWYGETIDASIAATAPVAPFVGAYTVFWNGAAIQRWVGAAQNSDNIAATTAAPWVGGFTYAYDGATWDRVTSTTAADNLSSTQQGLNTLSFNLFYNGTNYQRWTGATLSDALSASPVVPYVGAFNLYSDGANFRRWTGEPADDSMSMANSPNVNAAVVYYNGSAFQIFHGEAFDNSMTAAPVNPNTNAFNVFFNGTASQYWTGEALDDVGTATAPTLPWVGAYNLFYDGSVSRRWTGETIDDSMTAAPVAPFTSAYNLFYNGTNAQRWTGLAVQADNVSNSTPMPWVSNFGYSYHAGGTSWDGITSITSADNLSATPQGLEVVDYMHFFNGTNYQRWTGDAWDSSLSLTTAPPVIGLTAFYNGTAGQYWQGSVLSGETVANTTYAPHVKDFLYGYDATSGSWRWVNTLASQADSQATTLNGLVTSSMLYAYNSGTATLNMLRLGSSNELYVQDISVRAGEDPGNDWVKTRKESVSTTSPDATTGTAVTGGAGLTVVLAARDVSQDLNWCVYLKNTDGADAFTNAAVETSPNNSDWTSDLGWTGCDSLAAGSTCSYCVNGSAFKYIRVRVASAADVTVSAWFFGNRG